MNSIKGRVFILEDNPIAANIVDFVKSWGYEVVRAWELDSTIWYLEEEPGLDAFDKLLFDLSVPWCEAEHQDGRRVTYQGAYCGLEFIRENYMHSEKFRRAVNQGRLALVTAHDKGMQPEFARILKDNPGLEKKIVIISKLADDMAKQLRDFLDKEINSDG
jgi:CheY-like chemotaxis protein